MKRASRSAQRPGHRPYVSGPGRSGGLAARLVAEQRLPVDDLESTLAEMRQAIDHSDLRSIPDCLLRFQLGICVKPGNPYARAWETNSGPALCIHPDSLLRLITGS
jgi:hypothetical protein